MESCLYEGLVKHRRFTPIRHAFSYRMFYLYIDLDELDTLFERRWLWSTSAPALAWFRRKDHFGPSGESLKESVLACVEDSTGKRPQGPVRMLTHLRYFGFLFNPVSFYYCFDGHAGQPEAIVAEVSNTPWGERHLYVLPVSQNRSSGVRMRFDHDKEFHVSPFMPMDMHYRWSFSNPEKFLTVRIDNYREAQKLFSATLALKKRELSGARCASVLARYPFLTARIIVAIYWQAMKLYFKGAPVYSHPEKLRPLKGGARKARP